MKYFIAFTLVYFSYSILLAANDECAFTCTEDCRTQVISAVVEIESHRGVCEGRPPTVTHSECAQACSKGCRAVMRGQQQIVEEHFEKCGSGNGRYGKLTCENNGGQYYAVNTHTKERIGAGFPMEHLCVEAIETLDYNVFCTKSEVPLKGGRYGVYSLNNISLGVPTSFLYQCHEQILNIKNGKICVGLESGGYGDYDLNTLSRVSQRTFSFFSNCLDSL